MLARNLCKADASREGENGMDNEHALEIINALASGIDPFTGEVHSQGSVLQNPETVRALFLAARALEAMTPRKKGKPRDPALPASAGKSWSEEEDRQLVAAFDSGQTEQELAESHKRTRGAIQARLVKLGKMEPPASRT